MVSRRVVFLTSILATAISFFTLGLIHARDADASVRAAYDARLEALRDEVHRELGKDPMPAGTSGETTRPRAAGKVLQGTRAQDGRRDQGGAPERNGAAAGASAARAAIELRRAVRRRQLRQDELRHGRLSGRRILRDGQARRGRAEGRGQPPGRAQDRRDQDRVQRQGDPGASSSTPGMRKWKSTAATGRSSRRRELDLPPLTVDTAFAYDFAEPIFRLGNDYSKGIIVSTGYVGQKTAGGLVTCLTDGHPGRVGRRRARSARPSRRHPDRPDAGRLPLLVHPADASRDAAEGAGVRRAGTRGRRRVAVASAQ